MKQIQFRGANRNTGFSPVQVGQGEVSQMRARDSQAISDLKEAQNQKNKLTSERIQNLESNFQKEKANRNELKTLEDQTAATRQAAIKQNAEQSIENSRVETANAAEGLKTWEALTGFSKTISDEITKYQDAKNESDMEEAYAEALASGLPTERIVAQQAMENELRRAGMAEDAIADEMARRGVSPNVVTKVRSGNKWRDYGRLKAYAEMAGDGYGPWLQDQLNQLGPEAAGPVARAAAVQQLQQQYLKQNGLFGLSADFLGPMFSKMRTSSNGVMESSRKREVVNSSTELFEEARTTLYGEKTPEALNALFRVKATGYDDGSTLNGNRAGVEAVFGELKNFNRYTDQEVDYLLNNTITDNGETFAERYGGMYTDLRAERAKAADANRGLIDRQRKAAGKEKVEDAMTFFESQPGIDMGALDETINKFKQEGFDVGRLEALKYATGQEINKRKWETDLQEQWDTGTLTADDLKDVNIPQELRYKWLDRVNKLDAAKAASGRTQAEMKEALKSQLKFNLVGDAIDKTPDSTLGLATASAMRMYNSKFSNYLQSMSAEQASDRAWNEVYGQVSRGEGAFKVTKTPSGKATPPFYGAFKPNRGFAGPGLPAWDKSPQELVEAAKADPSFMSTTPIISSSDAAAGLKAHSVNGTPNVPQVLQTLASQIPDKTALDLYEEQIEAVSGEKVEFERPAADVLKDQIKDPVLQEILNRPTVTNVNTAILSTEYAGGYSSPDPRGQSLITMAARNGWDPADIAAIVSFETGGTLDPGQPGYGAAAGRLGLIQAGPTEQGQYGLGSGDWNREMQGIENYLRDRGAKPGMGLEDLYATVNGGNPNAGNTPDGNGTIPRSPETIQRLLEHKAQASERLGIVKSTYPPARDPNNMSPTLQHFYTTGGETNGGWSEHTDFKQVDNPDTVQDEWGQYWDPNELDAYIHFEDPEYGVITLSELRRRIPISGGNFGDPRSYGPHAGWDYGTKAGTKLYLKNGARKISTVKVPGNGWRSTFKLPDGRYFAALHGQGV